MDILERMPWVAQDAVFQRLAEVAEVSKLSKEDRLEYDHALKRYRDTLNAMAGAEQKGVEKGRAEGIRDTARKMKQKGLSADLIAEMTGLSLTDIEQLY